MARREARKRRGPTSGRRRARRRPASPRAEARQDREPVGDFIGARTAGGRSEKMDPLERRVLALCWKNNLRVVEQMVPHMRENTHREGVCTCMTMLVQDKGVWWYPKHGFKRQIRGFRRKFYIKVYLYTRNSYYCWISREIDVIR